MTKRMLIDASHPEETRVVVLDGRRIEDFDYESASRKQLKGNIYLAKVTRVEPSLQAAFIEYGGNRHGFLPFNEIHPDYFHIQVADKKALIAEQSRLPESRSAEPRDAESRDAGGAGAPGAEAGEDEDGRSAGRRRRRRRPRRGEAGASDSAGGEDGASATESHEAGASDDHLQAGFDQAGDDDAVPQDGFGSDPDDAGDDDDTQDGGGRSGGSVPLAAENVVAELSDDGEGSGNGGRRGRRRGSGRRGGGEEEGEERPTSLEVLGGDDEEEVRRQRTRALRSYKIQEVIRKRDLLLVQVTKEERGTKGAALTTYVSLAGRYCVLMPNSARGGGISRRITSVNDRRRLKSIIDELDLPESMAVIVRTAGSERSKPEIKRDYDYLARLWDDIRERTLNSTAPALIYEEGSLIKRAIRDLYSRDIDKVLVEGEEGYRVAKDFMRMLMPSHAKRVQQYREAVPLFQRHQVEGPLDAIHNPSVNLKSGGYIVLNQTEALVAIDVNSGRSTKERNIEETALKTNLEAADEVARQLRLRDLAGLIVIDFIDMEETRNIQAVERRLKEALKQDRARIQIGRISLFGLLEMSRQRLRPSLAEANFVRCPHCAGTGLIRSTESMALHVLRAIEEEGLRDRSDEIAVYTATPVALYILNQKRAALHAIEARYALRVMVDGDDSLLPPALRIDQIRERSAEARALAVDPTSRPLAMTAPTEDEDDLEPEEQDRDDGDRNDGDRNDGDREDAAAEVEDAADSVGSAGGAEQAESDEGEDAAGGDGDKRRRRRRRRRRGGRDDAAASGETAEAVGEDSAAGNPAPTAEHVVATRAREAEAGPETDVPETDVSETDVPKTDVPETDPGVAIAVEVPVVGEAPEIPATAESEEAGAARPRRSRRRGTRRRDGARADGTDTPAVEAETAVSDTESTGAEGIDEKIAEPVPAQPVSAQPAPAEPAAEFRPSGSEADDAGVDAGTELDTKAATPGNGATGGQPSPVETIAPAEATGPSGEDLSQDHGREGQPPRRGWWQRPAE